ncbi:hypothetical protein LCGC14_1240790 [marine sediment metagenome]|uniref:Toprim domain-containing protein n=1 Tax=marine sediment metagenome TaxID=412755 RepID=A0A0F9L5V1_9ZZZZ
MFDAIAYLESQGIPCHTEGKNVTQGWVNIQCIYPGCDDNSNHLGTNLSTGLHTCWKCKKKGGPEQLIMGVQHCGYGEAQTIAAKFGGAVVPIRERNVRHVAGSFMLPKAATEEFPPPHFRYLVGRGYDPVAIQEQYRILSCHTIGKYRLRLIIPIFINDVLVNFIARDVTGLAEKKYLMAPNDEALLPGEMVLYNIDRAVRSVAIVEGVFDVWRIGDGAVGLLGTELSEEKLRLLPEKGVERAFIIYDEDAHNRGIEVASKVSKLVPYTENIWLPRDDPDKYFAENPNELTELRFLLR